MRNLLYETAYLIYAYIPDVLPEDTEDAEDIGDVKDTKDITHANFMRYVGRGLNEMFSSNPTYSAQNLSPMKKLTLSNILIEQGLFSSLSPFDPYEIENFTEAICFNWFPNYRTNEDQNLLYNECLNTDGTEQELKDKHKQ